MVSDRIVNLSLWLEVGRVDPLHSQLDLTISYKRHYQLT